MRETRAGLPQLPESGGEDELLGRSIWCALRRWVAPLTEAPRRVAIATPISGGGECVARMVMVSVVESVHEPVYALRGLGKRHEPVNLRARSRGGMHGPVKPERQGVTHAAYDVAIVSVDGLKGHNLWWQTAIAIQRRRRR